MRGRRDIDFDRGPTGPSDLLCIRHPHGLENGPWMQTMGPYTLRVFHEGSPLPIETARASRAPEVLERIPELLKKHPGCHRIHVETVAGFLFMVDCNGETVLDDQDARPKA